MSAFFDRYLPRSERRTALWLAVGGTAVVTAADWFGSGVGQQAALSIEGGPEGVAVAVVAAFAQFALVTLVLAALIRFARAPRSLALYLVLVGVIVAVADILRAALGFMDVTQLDAERWDVLMRMVAFPLGPLAWSAGAVAGAWVADTVSLARIRDTGFSGDEDPSGAGLRARPVRAAWRFMGWEGRPVTGEPLVAVALAVARAIPALTGVVAIRMATVFLLASNTVDIGWWLVAIDTIALTLAWFVSAHLVTRRLGTVSIWLVPAAAALVTGGWSASFLPQAVASGASEIIELIGSTTPQLAAIAAALLGTASALRAKPATLTAPDPQDPGATPPADTAGGI